MSTRSSLKYEHNPETGDGFNLYTDWLDECAGADVVHLVLTGVPFEAACDGAGMRVELTLPRAVAERLGLVAPRTEPADERSQ